jgi:hypothetical protein
VLCPTDDESQSVLRKHKAGSEFWVEIRKARNPKHHRLYFALLKLTFDNQERYENFELFRKAVQIAAGHVDELVTLDGEVLMLPKSVAFDSLDEDEFTQVFCDAMAVCAKILGDMDLDHLRQEVERYAA